MPLFSCTAKTATATVFFALLAAGSARSQGKTAVSCPIDTASKTKSWVLMQERVVAKGLTGSTRQRTEDGRKRTEVAYIRACGALGDYYAVQHAAGTLPNLSKAIGYYEKVIHLTSGTDGDLGDNGSYIERNKVCCRVATLYNSGKLDAQGVRSAYVGHFIDARIAGRLSTFTGAFTDGIVVSIPFLIGNSGLGPTVRRMLKSVAGDAAMHPDKKLLVTGGGSCGSYLAQQVSWERAAGIVEYLTDSCGLPKDRFIFMYCAGTPAEEKASIRYAPDGSEGPAMQPPPMPQLFATEDPWARK